MEQASYLWAESWCSQLGKLGFMKINSPLPFSLSLSLAFLCLKVKEKKTHSVRWLPHAWSSHHPFRQAKVYGITRKKPWKTGGWEQDNCLCTSKERLKMKQSSYVSIDIWANAVMSVPENICKYYNLVQSIIEYVKSIKPFQKLKIQDINV